MWDLQCTFLVDTKVEKNSKLVAFLKGVEKEEGGKMRGGRRGPLEFEARRRQFGAGGGPRPIRWALIAFALLCCVLVAWVSSFRGLTGIRAGAAVGLRSASAGAEDPPSDLYVEGDHVKSSGASKAEDDDVRDDVDQSSVDNGQGDDNKPVDVDHFGEDLDEGVFELLMYGQANCNGDVVARIQYDPDDADKVHSTCNVANVDVKSLKLVGGPEIDWYSSCSRDNTYVGSLFESEGCVARYHYPVAQSFRFRTTSSLEAVQIPDEILSAQWALQDHKPALPAGSSVPKARIIFSCESAEYFGYQVWANLYGYFTSGQASASWTRLLTAGRRDDLADATPGLATFQAKRTLYSRRYSPINKPDVLSKWFLSADAPKEEVIVVIDPDNWLLKDVGKYVDMVSPGNAVGEPAYYHGSRTAQKLWKELCRENCDWTMDLVGVPYFVHRDDLARIAPLWRSYTIQIKDLADKDKEFEKKYGRLDLAWASEMFGYNMASAHVGVKHKVVPRIQVRDVDGEHRKSKLQDVAMIHVGRAWMPHDYKPAQQWAHTEGKSFSNFGQQVWCKCNFTASQVMPWPVPPEADFQSTRTLEMMHYSIERFGPIPVNRAFRRGSANHGQYGATVD